MTGSAFCTSCHAELPPGTRVCPSCHALQRAVAPTAETRAPLDLGYGKVTFDTKLGEGATAVVWRGALTQAVDGADVTVVAVKEVRSEQRSHPGQRDQARALLHNEATALRAIEHPNVVQLIDVLTIDDDGAGVEALVFEYIEGETLESLLARQADHAKRVDGTTVAGLSYGFSWSVFEQLLAALHATHAAGRVHADVKPANLMLTLESRVKLTDFGLARRIGAAPSAREAGAGTSSYISPEQVLGHPLDPRSDLYSAASMLFEMLTGRTVFDTEGRTELAVRMDQVHRAPPALRTFLPDAPPSLDGLFGRALAKDPRARFSSAAEMRDAFGTILQLAGRVHGRRR